MTLLAVWRHLGKVKNEFQGFRLVDWINLDRAGYTWIHLDTKSEAKSGTIQYGRGPSEGLHELNTNLIGYTDYEK